jgi:hypothetical protein
MLTTLIIVSISVALGVGLSGGGPEVVKESTEHWEKAIKRKVDDDREKEAKKILKSAKKSAKEAQKGANEALDLYFAVDRNYDAKMEEYEVAIKQMNDVWVEFDDQLIDVRFQMMDLLTDKEWKECNKYIKKKMKKTNKDVKKGIKKQEKAHKKQLKKVEKLEKKAAKKKAAEEK